MKQIRLLTLLALLMTAATGAWAQEPATTYSVKMKAGTQDAKNWSIASGEKSAKGDAADGLTGLSEKDAVTLTYTGRRKVKGVKATSDAAPAAGNIVDLSTLTDDYEAQDGDVLTGTLAGNYKISIADGATVTLSGAVINGANNSYWAGLTLAGDGTIILSGENSVKGFYEDYPGIFVPVNKTLTIQGDGSLTASSNGYGAGIGGGFDLASGNITIEGGTITATGGSMAAGIGGGRYASCGDISITGGTVTATGGGYAAGIGSGVNATCGAITITSGVTKVTATKADNATNSIGKGNDGSCGTVTIGGTKYWENNAAVNGGDTYLATSPLIYDPAAPATPATTTVTWNSSNVSDLNVMGTYQSYTKESITLSANADQNEAEWMDFGDESMNGIVFHVNVSGGFTFTAPTGKNFTKIEMTLTNSGGWDIANLGTGWAFGEDYVNEIYKVTWTGSAASTVGLLTGADYFSGERVKSIAFYLSE